MASKKGIAITAAIAAGIIGASFLIWLIPQEDGVNVRQITPPQHQAIFQEVYSQHTGLALDIESKYDLWKKGSVSSDTMSSAINDAKTNTGNLRKSLVDAKPPQDWQQSYNSYMAALDTFGQYLDGIKSKVQAEDKFDDSAIDGLKQKWEADIDSAIKSVPV